MEGPLEECKFSMESPWWGLPSYDKRWWVVLKFFAQMTKKQKDPESSWRPAKSQPNLAMETFLWLKTSLSYKFRRIWPKTIRLLKKATKASIFRSYLAIFHISGEPNYHIQKDQNPKMQENKQKKMQEGKRWWLVFCYNFMRAILFSRKQDKVWGANWFCFWKQVKLFTQYLFSPFWRDLGKG